MKIGYLSNTYPLTSATFIRREIEALEALGVSIKRFAVRRWDQPLVDAADKAEQNRTAYLMQDRPAGMLLDLFTAALTNPVGVARAAASCWRLWRNARRNPIAHVAYLAQAATLRKWAQKDGISHIHCHFSTNSAAVALLCARMGGPGYSMTAHGPDEFLAPEEASLVMKIDHARFVVAISHFARMTMILACGGAQGDKIHVVRCGLALEDFTVSSAPFDSKTFVGVGRLCAQKGQTLIPEAVEAVIEAHPDAKVILIGDGDTRVEIENQIDARGLVGRVELLGWRDNKDVRAYVGAARAFLMPSFAEGLPIAIMEALALGRPVITTYIAGIPELVDRGCGWIIPASDQAALITAMDQALCASSEELAAMGAEGRRRIEAQHDLSRNAADLLALIQDASK